MNLTLMNKVRTIFVETNLPEYLWNEWCTSGIIQWEGRSKPTTGLRSVSLGAESPYSYQQVRTSGSGG
ncbi:hypothetical protein PR048_013528 [Dryococelus australis]|uniref:Uncharacterized protein n=1 Tax=Dryococelus australis TaxID=614101 RepID=A0ABQ9HSF2_9NEOP|nr:hypothetical protein PR048_013528 [Dryococelus australis]